MTLWPLPVQVGLGLAESCLCNSPAKPLSALLGQGRCAGPGLVLLTKKTRGEEKSALVKHAFDCACLFVLDFYVALARREFAAL